MIVGVVLLAGAEDEREVAAPPEECIDAWNADREQRAFGRHNALAHGYSRAQVAYATTDGGEVSSEPVTDGGCVVIFGATRLDPEPVSAAQIELGDGWRPLSASADPARLAELQSAALAEANAELGRDGRLSAP